MSIMEDMIKIDKNTKTATADRVLALKTMNIDIRDKMRKSGMNDSQAESFAIILTNFHNEIMDFKSSVESKFKEVNARFDQVNARFENMETRLSFIEKLIVALLGITVLSAFSNLAVLIKLTFGG